MRVEREPKGIKHVYERIYENEVDIREVRQMIIVVAVGVMSAERG